MSSNLEVREATIDEIEEIWKLTHDEYLEAGYITKQEDGLYRHHSHFDLIPETTQIIVVKDNQIIGTCTYTLDNSNKVFTDIDYPKETEIIRVTNVPLAAVWRLATSSKERSTHRIVHMLMSKIAADLVEKGEPILLCEVHPRHQGYYEKRFGFVAIAEKDDTEGLQNAPSILMIGGKNTYKRIIK